MFATRLLSNSLGRRLISCSRLQSPLMARSSVFGASQPTCSLHSHTQPSLSLLLKDTQSLLVSTKRHLKLGLTPAIIEQRVLDVCKQMEGFESTEITLDSNFMSDLGMQSLEHIELITSMEDEFQLEISEVDLETLTTPRHIVNHLCKAVEKAQPII